MYCTSCGTELPESYTKCSSCGNQSAKPDATVAQIESDLRFVLPLATPISAIAAGYLGMLSVLLIPAPFALISGIIGLRSIKRKKGMHGKVRCWLGIVMGGVFTLVLLFVFIM